MWTGAHFCHFRDLKKHTLYTKPHQSSATGRPSHLPPPPSSGVVYRISQKRIFLSKCPLMTHCSVQTISLQLDPANTVFMPARRANIRNRAEAAPGLCREHRFPLALSNQRSLFKHTLKHGKLAQTQRPSEYKTGLARQTVSR